MNFDNYLFRCSALGQLMTEPKTKEQKARGELGETCKTYLREIWIEAKYGRTKDISNKYVEKGLGAEEDAITLYSRVMRRFFKKNEQRLSNAFITGHPDIYTGESIHNADEVTDTKCSWDIFTFFKSAQNLNKDYYWQLQGYCALSKAKLGRLAYCLVDTPEQLINDELRRLLFRMNVASEESTEYKEAASAMMRNMVYGDIPINERVVEHLIPRNDDAIMQIYQQVVRARKYLNELEALHQASLKSFSL